MYHLPKTSTVRVIVISEVKEEKKQELLDLLGPVIGSRKEEANISYDLYSFTGNPN
jgi:quinol monooxygenase YgiN